MKFDQKLPVLQQLSYQVLGMETLGQCITFMALPGFGLSCKIKDVDFLRKSTEGGPKSKLLEVRVNGVLCEPDADRGINRRIFTGQLVSFFAWFVSSPYHICFGLNFIRNF